MVKIISKLDLDRAVQLKRQEIARLLGDNTLEEAYADEFIRPIVLGELIDKKLLISSLKRHNVVSGEVYTKEAITSIPQFQVDGSFSQPLYQQILSSQGLTTETLLELVGNDLVLQNFLSGIQNSEIITADMLSNFISIVGEARSYTYLRLPIAEEIGHLHISEQEIEQYYHDNKHLYKQPEKITVDYILIDNQQIESSINIDEEEIKERYQLKKKSANSHAEVAHIFIKRQGDDDTKLANKLKTIQTHIDAGEDFAELAKKIL